MVQTPVRQMTLAEFLELPETKPASEYIDGQVIQKPMPQGHHSIIQSELSTELILGLKRQGIAVPFTELRCTFGGKSIVPDIAVFENHRVPNNDGKIENVFTIAPDWTIEVLSPGQSVTKVLKNINHCLTHGAQMGWLINPNEQSVIVSRMDQNTEVIDEPQVILPVPGFATAINLSIEQMFKWLDVA